MRCVLSLLSEAGMVQPHLALHSNRLENFQDYLKKAMSASINPYHDCNRGKDLVVDRHGKYLLGLF